MIQLPSLLLVLADNDAFVDEDEGEAFDFDSGDDIPEADHPPPEAPSPSCVGDGRDRGEASRALLTPDLPEPSIASNTAPALADTTTTSRPRAAGGDTAEEVASAADREAALPPPPPLNSDPKHTGL